MFTGSCKGWTSHTFCLTSWYLFAGAFVAATNVSSATCSADVTSSTNRLSNIIVQAPPIATTTVPLALLGQAIYTGGSMITAARRSCSFLWNEIISTSLPYSRFMNMSGLAQAVQCSYPDPLAYMDFVLYVDIASLQASGGARWVVGTRHA